MCAFYVLAGPNTLIISRYWMC